MSEPMWTTIKCGGNLSKKNYEKLQAIINGEFSDQNDFDKDGCVRGNVNWGNPEDTVAFCEKHRISYDLHCEATSEYDADLTYWRPGMPGPLSSKSDQSGDPQIDASKVRLIADVLMALLESKGDKSALALFIDRDESLTELIEKATKGKNPVKLLQKWLDDLCPMIPPLPPFIVK